MTTIKNAEKITVPQQLVLTALWSKDRTKQDLIQHRGCDAWAINAMLRAGRIVEVNDGNLRLIGVSGTKTPSVEVPVPSTTEFSMIDDCEDLSKQTVVKTTRTPRMSKAKKGVGICKCGCKTACKRNFVPGHDGRLHGLVLADIKANVQRAWEPETLAYLSQATWVTPEMAKAIDL